MLINRLTAAVAVACAVATASTSALAKDHADTAIAYMTCDGTQWRAQWDGDGFFHTPRNGGPGHSDIYLAYKAWDGSCFRLRWDSQAHEFFITPISGGPGRYDYEMNYITWSGENWTAVRVDPSKFYHIGPR